MSIPKHLKHKPILGVENYEIIDGKYAGNSDAKAISIGKAQWDNNEISAKVFRHTGTKWSRQSEELPLHRVLDLANLILSAYLQKQGNYVQSTILNEEIIEPDEYEKIKEYIKDNPYLEERIRELQNTLKKIQK
ncbi:hypothetical protein KC678_01475 [Candidatus Dojkabacteria bacterium]|uniref:Uncharacterized protein n=1 Tax=Candidatus Dojkabacteria bacterium TaxID=2099670 RepID=A0A955L175_9BACT|nr:hypothetical protein [Candidatus Dojkabacteria bacterium]